MCALQICLAKLWPRNCGGGGGGSFVVEFEHRTRPISHLDVIITGISTDKWAKLPAVSALMQDMTLAKQAALSEMIAEVIHTQSGPMDSPHTPISNPFCVSLSIPSDCGQGS